MSKEMERLKEIEAKKEELRGKLDAEEINAEEIKGIQDQARALADEEKEIREKIALRTALKSGAIVEPEDKMNEEEVRAKNFVETGKMEVRAVLSTGTIAKPTSVDSEVNELAESIGSIVDDVKAIKLTGTGAYTKGYKKAEATAADVTDGSNLGGTGSDYGYVTINPAEWAAFDEVSNQVAKLSPIDYAREVKYSALIALRTVAEEKVMAAVQASALLEKLYSYTLDQNYLRNVVLGFKSIKGKGGVKLYLNRADLITLGEVRGTQDKKAVYNIAFKEGTNMEGTITEGGISVPFSVSDEIAVGKQLFGQPKTIEMPMWDKYKIETNAGGEFFRKNEIGIRGIQTANADLCALHGMQLISQAAEPHTP